MPAFPNPFPGLRPFEAADRDRFFGRDLQVQELGQRLAENRVITIIGGSGCGKSSLVRAGLLPALTGLGISTAGRAYCWGFGQLGNLGNGTISTSSADPVLVKLVR